MIKKEKTMDIDSDDSQEYEEEDLVTRLQQPTPLMDDEVVDKNSVEHRCCMLAKMDRINDHGVACQTWQCKSMQHKNSQFDYNNDSKGTFSEPIDV